MKLRGYRPIDRRLPLAAASIAIIAVVVLLLRGGPEPGSPEARIRQLIADAEAAVEARSLAPIEELLVDDFSGGSGIDRKRALQLLRLHYLRNQSIHLMSRIKRLEVEGDRARVELVVAMAGEPIEDLQAAIDLRADLHRFDLTLALIDDAWQVSRATWRRVTVLEELTGGTD